MSSISSNDYSQSPKPVSGMVYLLDGFSDQECDRIISMGLSQPQEPAMLEGDNLQVSYRKNRVSWLRTDDVNNAWLNGKIAGIVRQINQEYYRYNITALENYQFTIYDQVDDCYHDHIDLLDNYQFHRKLSFSVQLSHANDYQGGELEVNNGFGFKPAIKTRGSITAFPSFRMHRVKPITAGQRYSLVIWALGPYFT